jgi:imidazoleglycerol phosphate dehydratase HisB
MQMRKGKFTRKTSETDIAVMVNLDGSGTVSSDTSVAFLDHMLAAFGKHGRFDLTVKARGDITVDPHHIVEDIGIVLGKAIKEAIGDGKGISRFAHTGVPMDEALAIVTIDCGGRGYLVFNGTFSEMPVGTIPGTLFEHFFYSLCTNAGITVHLTFSGQNDHHKCEALFKAFGRALSEATRIDPSRTGVPSTKGVL